MPQQSIVTQPAFPFRKFDTGATRDTDTNKIDPDGFLSPLVLQCYFDYMHKNRFQADGSIRTADNWQKGIPMESYRSSLWRHFFAFWTYLRGWSQPKHDWKADACGILFNTMGAMHERLKQELALASPMLTSTITSAPTDRPGEFEN